MTICCAVGFVMYVDDSQASMDASDRLMLWLYPIMMISSLMQMMNAIRIWKKSKKCR